MEHFLYVKEMLKRKYWKMMGKCSKCGGDMKKSSALVDICAFNGEKQGKVVSCYAGGPGKIVTCLKCRKCGWSVRD